MSADNHTGAAMSTRATYEFKDQHESFTIYKHCDGYPEGAYQWIANALPAAWSLPRFEACEFAAAFIAGNKEGAGGVYVSNGRDSHGDTAYHYVATCQDGQIHVERFVPRDGSEDAWKLEQAGILADLLKEHAPKGQWLHPLAGHLAGVDGHTSHGITHTET
jgi:hypothetical protein